MSIYKFKVVTQQPSLDGIITHLQLCIVDAKALQLKMLERILSIALLQVYEDSKESEDRDQD
jgi:hypothetical protein